MRQGWPFSVIEVPTTLRVEAVAAGPRAVAEHRRAFRARRHLLPARNSRPSGGLRAEHRQQVRRGADDANALRIAPAGQVVVAADRDRDLLEAADGCS